MADSNDIGYGKPPKATRFVSGKSGNPNGRPKGSQNLSTVLHKAVRQRVTVTENGRARQVTKLEAILIQLINKALRGDVGAVHELRYWIQFLEDSVQTGSQSAVSHENDEAVIASALERIRQAESLQADGETDSAKADSIEEER